jgi:GR25 family glycosyltransferase involved in LPS biosynthesis
MEKQKTLGFDKIYVINLKRRPDRKETLIKTLNGIDLTFIEAVDGKELSVNELISEGKLNKSFFDPWGKVTMGIFACALSHNKAWEQALEDGVENALFLEDDVYLTIPVLENGKFTKEYQSIYNEIQQYDWDLVHLGKKTEGQSGINVGNHLVIPKYNTNYNGAHSYIATRDMIKTLLDEYTPVKYAADIYLEQFYNTHNTFTLKKNLFKQISDNFNAENADSDTYYNEYREGGGRVGLSFDENGNVLDKKIVNYLKHPKDLIDKYMEIVLEKPKFGVQKFNKPNFFGISNLLGFLLTELGKNETMVEIYPHFGELTFFFGSCGLFTNIYSIDPLCGEDEFNVSNEITWDDVKIGFHSNTYHFKNVSYIKKTPEEVCNDFNNISFLFINNRNNQNILSLISQYYDKIKDNGYIGGDCYENIKIPNAKIFDNGYWVVKKNEINIEVINDKLNLK